MINLLILLLATWGSQTTLLPTDAGRESGIGSTSAYIQNAPNFSSCKSSATAQYYITTPEATMPKQLYTTTYDTKEASQQGPKRLGIRRYSPSDWDDTEENAGDVLPVGTPLLPLLLLAGLYTFVTTKKNGNCKNRTRHSM